MAKGTFVVSEPYFDEEQGTVVVDAIGTDDIDPFELLEAAFQVFKGSYGDDKDLFEEEDD